MDSGSSLHRRPCQVARTGPQSPGDKGPCRYPTGSGASYQFASRKPCTRPTHPAPRTHRWIVSTNKPIRAPTDLTTTQRAEGRKKGGREKRGAVQYSAGRGMGVWSYLPAASVLVRGHLRSNLSQTLLVEPILVHYPGRFLPLGRAALVEHQSLLHAHRRAALDSDDLAVLASGLPVPLLRRPVGAHPRGVLAVPLAEKVPFFFAHFGQVCTQTRPTSSEHTPTTAKPGSTGRKEANKWCPRGRSRNCAQTKPQQHQGRQAGAC